MAAPSEQATQVLPETGEQPVAAEPSATGDQPTVAGGGQTVAIPPLRDLPAGVDPSEYAETPAASAPRGKLRRRLRYLRRVRDLLLRDLGGFTFEIHRTAGGTPTDSHRTLAESKMSRIEALDAEVRALEGRLGEPHEPALLREPGIGGICPECGELHSSDAHYCARCGAPLDAKARAKREAALAAAVKQTASAKPGAEPTTASGLWAAGPRPGGAEPEPAPEEQRSEVTNKWLAVPRRAEEPSAEAKPQVREPESEAAADAPDQPVAAKANEVVAAKPDEALEDAPDEAVADASDEAVAAKPHESATAEGATGAAATDETAAGATATDETATAEDATDESATAEGAAEFDPAPNGRRSDEVPAPDPLSSQPERGA